MTDDERPPHAGWDDLEQRWVTNDVQPLDLSEIERAEIAEALHGLHGPDTVSVSRAALEELLEASFVACKAETSRWRRRSWYARLVFARLAVRQEIDR